MQMPVPQVGKVLAARLVCARETGNAGQNRTNRMAKRLKTKRFSLQGYNLQHFQATEQYAAMVEALFDRATEDVVSGVANVRTGDEPFSFDDYPSAKKKLDAIVAQLAGQIRAVIESGSRKQWLFACKKNDAFLDSILHTSKLSRSRLAKYQDRNLDALQTFQGRKVDGMDLSQRVWKYTSQYKTQIEQAIDVGLGEGRSAQALARDVKQSLKYPDKLFRRVRDKRGNLHLSKNAAAFHPGQGVYRSSVKNAQRLTRSEINMAYRESDFRRWQQLDFVVGIEIRRSNHNPLCKCKLCERLVGRYPKETKFVGFHPQCMCYVVPILADEETFDKNELGDLRAALRGEEYTHQAAKNAVTDVPQGMKDWIAENAKKQANWGSTPYFVRDNFKNGKLSDGLKFDTTAQSYENDPNQKALDAMQGEINRAFSVAGEWSFTNSANMLQQAIDEKDPQRAKLFCDSIFSTARYWQGKLDQYNNKAQTLFAKAQPLGVDVSGVKNLLQSINANKGSLTEPSNENLLNQVFDQLEKAIAAAERAKAGVAGIHPAIRTQYDTNKQVDETFKAINAELSGDKWFEHGDLVLTPTNKSGVNGYTYVDGRISLKPERVDGVRSALGKIGQGKADEITFKEADAMATFWHEITHNRNKPYNWLTTDRTDAQTRAMEMANEYVARHTLPEFYGKLGVKDVPHPDFITYRASTGYNRRVCNYQHVIKELGLDEAKVLAEVRKHLFNGNYNDQDTGLINGLIAGGIKKLNGKKATKLQSLLKLMRDDYSTDAIDRWLEREGYKKPLADDEPEPLW